MSIWPFTPTSQPLPIHQMALADYDIAPECIPSPIFPAGYVPPRAGTYPDHNVKRTVWSHYDDPLGDEPVLSVAVLADLGLSDDEIARYFSVDVRRIKSLLDAAA